MRFWHRIVSTLCRWCMRCGLRMDIVEYHAYVLTVERKHITRVRFKRSLITIGTKILCRADTKKSESISDQNAVPNAAHEWTVTKVFKELTNELNDDVLINKAKGDQIVTVRLKRSQCKNVADFIEFGLIDQIRDDTGIDNVAWIEDMIGAMRTLEEAAKMDGEKNEH